MKYLNEIPLEQKKKKNQQPFNNVLNPCQPVKKKIKSMK